MIDSGKLERDLQKLSKMQKRALTTNGPHPHHIGMFQTFNSSNSFSQTQQFSSNKEPFTPQEPEFDQTYYDQEDEYYQYYDEQQQKKHDTYRDGYYDDNYYGEQVPDHSENGAYYRQTTSAKYRKSDQLQNRHIEEKPTKKTYQEYEASTKISSESNKYSQSRSYYGNANRGAGDHGATAYQQPKR